MSRTVKGSKAPGFEFWGVRGSNDKTTTHRIERRQNGKVVRKELKQMYQQEK